ncbi:MAG: HNH endonuclease [Candidatus Ranarchaeia archaeon]
MYCGAETTLTVDHMIPLLCKRPDHHDNAVLACSRYNSSKGDKRLYEFFRSDNRNKIPRIVEGKYLKPL